MHVDNQAVRGTILKVNRAHNHLQALNREMKAWKEKQPFSVVSEQANPEGSKYFLRLRLDEPIPVEWSIVLGEVFYDLRSALDQCVYWLTVDHEGKALPLTQFPVYIKKANYIERSKNGRLSSSGGLFKIRGLGPGPHTYISALQPYPQRTARACHSIRELHDFCNQDKHRLVHVWGVLFSEFPKIRIEGPSPVVPTATAQMRRGLINDGAVAATAILDPPCPDMEVSGTGVAGVAVRRVGNTRRRNAEAKLFNMWDDVADVVVKLLRAIGHQDRPIPMELDESVFLPRDAPAVDRWPA